MKKLTFILLGCISALMISSQSFAETTMSQEGQYIFNSLGFYIGGVLVAFMAAGFCMLESGLVTTKSVSTIAAKNIGKFAICSLIFFLVGYNFCLLYRKLLHRLLLCQFLVFQLPCLFLIQLYF